MKLNHHQSVGCFILKSEPTGEKNLVLVHNYSREIFKLIDTVSDHNLISEVPILKVGTYFTSASLLLFQKEDITTATPTLGGDIQEEAEQLDEEEYEDSVSSTPSSYHVPPIPPLSPDEPMFPPDRKCHPELATSYDWASYLNDPTFSAAPVYNFHHVSIFIFNYLPI